MAPRSSWIVADAYGTSTSFRPEVEVNGKTTYVLVEQTVAVQPDRLGRVVAHLSHDEISAVNAALRTVLDL